MSEQNLKLAVGYECTPISDAEAICGEPKDVLDATRHYERFEYDFDLQEELAVYELRYPACWDKVLVSPYQYDFERIAPIMESMRRRGFVPTIDLCHHKPPKKIPNGFANPEFPEYLLDFALAFQEAFPWVQRYTIINEPAVTALFHSDEIALWANHKWTDVFLNMAYAISITSHALKKRNPRIKFFQPEPIDHDAIADDADEQIVAHVNFLHEHGRFGLDNLLRGKIDDSHPFYEHLVRKGAEPERVLWFRKNPAVEYQKDLDFYIHCFKVWFRDRKGRMMHKMNPNPPSLASVIADYKARLPEMTLGIGETNVRGTVRDRITFFKWVLEQCAQVGIKRISWWGLTDSYLWGDGNFTRWWRSDGRADPVGIYRLSDHPVMGRLWNRDANEFSEVFKSYAQGELSFNDIPAYRFTGEFRRALNGFARSHMKHWRMRSGKEKDISYNLPAGDLASAESGEFV